MVIAPEQPASTSVDIDASARTAGRAVTSNIEPHIINIIVPDILGSPLHRHGAGNNIVLASF